MLVSYNYQNDDYTYHAYLSIQVIVVTEYLEEGLNEKGH